MHRCAREPAGGASRERADVRPCFACPVPLFSPATGTAGAAAATEQSRDATPREPRPFCGGTAPVALARFLLALVRSASDSVVRCVIRSLLSSRVPCSAEHCPCARQACSRLFALRRLLHHPLTLMYLLTGRFGRFIQSLLHQRKYVKGAWIPGRRVM